jgi:hypothetical protein
MNSKALSSCVIIELTVVSLSNVRKKSFEKLRTDILVWQQTMHLQNSAIFRQGSLLARRMSRLFQNIAKQYKEYRSWMNEIFITVICSMQERHEWTIQFQSFLFS